MGCIAMFWWQQELVDIKPGTYFNLWTTGPEKGSSKNVNPVLA